MSARSVTRAHSCGARAYGQQQMAVARGDPLVLLASVPLEQGCERQHTEQERGDQADQREPPRRAHRQRQSAQLEPAGGDVRAAARLSRRERAYALPRFLKIGLKPEVAEVERKRGSEGRVDRIASCLSGDRDPRQDASRVYAV